MTTSNRGKFIRLKLNFSDIPYAEPRLKAGLEETPNQNCRFLNKHWVCLIGVRRLNGVLAFILGRGHKDSKPR